LQDSIGGGDLICQQIELVQRERAERARHILALPGMSLISVSMS